MFPYIVPEKQNYKFTKTWKYIWQNYDVKSLI